MSDPERETPSERDRQLDELVRRLPRIEPSPRFEARFWARLARAQATAAEPSPARALLQRWRTAGAWALGIGATGALAVFLSLGNPPLLEDDWELLTDDEQFDLLLEGDLELLAALDVLEDWDGS